MVEVEKLRNLFKGLYGRESRVFSAPGRVNLIGEHTDYNEGFVLPFAADRRTYVAAAQTERAQVEVHSFDVDGHAVFEIGDEPAKSEGNWVAYVHGVANALAEQGVALRGTQLAIASDVPIGAGLSSSAALEVSIGYALLKIAGAEVDLMQLALACQRAEHRFVGTRSGLMDQLTATFAEQDKALFIDCRSFELTPIPLNLGDAVIVVCDTSVKHTLAVSAYNERRGECEAAVSMLQKINPAIDALRDVSVEEFTRYESELPEPIRRRCRHVISENARTERAREALLNGNTSSLGKLIDLSHESLRDDYEVSCREVDIMVELAREQSGTYGARMMGGGFGGATVNLVRSSTVESFASSVKEGYKRATGLDATVILVETGTGVEEIF